MIFKSNIKVTKEGNIKSHKRVGFHPFSEKFIFGKTARSLFGQTTMQPLTNFES